MTSALALTPRRRRVDGRCPGARARLRACVLGGLVVVVGCAVGPDYVEREPTAPSAWSNLDARAHPSTRASAPGELSQWWRALNDPVLAALMQTAVAASPDLRSARARVREARARLAVASSNLLPTIDVGASALHRRAHALGVEEGAAVADVTDNLMDVGFDAAWELDVFGGVRRGTEAAAADVEASVAELNDVRVTQLAEVALNYIEVRQTQMLLQIARDNLASQSETLQLTEWRAQAGLVNSQDVEQATANREQTRAQIPTLLVRLAAAEHRLDVLLGQAPGTLHARLAAARELPAIPAALAVGIPAETLRQRPDVRAAERRLAAETARVGVAEAARYPRFTLSGSIGLDALTLAAFGESGTAAYSLLGGVTAPIFNAGRLKSQVVAQDALRAQVEVAYEQTVLAALQDVEDALVALAGNTERTETLTRAVEAARNAARLARMRYGVGVIDFQSVLDTERTVLTLEESLAATRAEAVLALVRLYKALGGGWSPQGRAAQDGASTSTEAR